ncbi:TIGR03089 family protein [Cellulomonas sp. NPDC089187]|uniref:TIGR03089 family protein n=1 Tax=Cellulomonas sp. NPDC089187 TaxID=3154970 RepID=UPI00341B4AA3
MTTPPRTIADLLTRLLREPGRPRLTWYGPDGERVELSGAVLDNWVAKTVNLLVEEFDSGPGTVVRIDLPPHWRSVVWALAVWRCGATVSVDDGPADVVVTDRPEAVGGDAAVVAVALPALARAWDGAALPAGAIDAASAVMTYGDVIGWVPEVDPAAVALQTPVQQVRHEGLFTLAANEERALVGTGDFIEAMRGAIAVLGGGGSLVLVSGREPEELARLAEMERVTHLL